MLVVFENEEGPKKTKWVRRHRVWSGSEVFPELFVQRYWPGASLDAEGDQFSQFCQRLRCQCFHVPHREYDLRGDVSLKARGFLTEPESKRREGSCVFGESCDRCASRAHHFLYAVQVRAIGLSYI